MNMLDLLNGEQTGQTEGGTADITVHEKQMDGSLKELHAATGGAFGGKCVDDAYRGFLEELVGKKVIEDFKDKCMDDYIDLFREFETKKRAITKGKPPKVVMTMPVTLSDLVKRKCKKPMKTVVGESSFGNSVNFDKQKLHIANAEFIKLFQPTIDGIIKHMESILYDSRYSHVKNILMVGGFSDCELLQDAIHNRFDQKRIIIPEDAGLAVLKGAVLSGHIPRAISGRVAKFTYGIQSWPPFNDRCHPVDKKVVIDGKARCRDVFFKFIEVGQQVTPGHKESQVFQVLKPDEDTLECTVYASTRCDPEFVDDQDCIRLGCLTVPLDRSRGGPIEVEETLIFGETELMVKAKDMVSGQEYQATLNLLGNAR